MEIEVKRSFYGIELRVKADNVDISESIESFEYGLKEDGKKDFSKRLGMEVSNSAIDQIVRVLDDMICYRDNPVDTSVLIANLFDKLPEEKQKSLIESFNKDYVFEEENPDLFKQMGIAANPMNDLKELFEGLNPKP